MVWGQSYGNIVLFMLFALLPLTYSLPYAEYLLIFTILVISIPTLYLVSDSCILIDEGINKVLIAFALYIVWMVFMLLNSGFMARTVIRIVQMFGCTFAFICGALIEFSDRQKKVIYFLVKFIIFINIIAWLCAGMPLHNFSFLVANTATYGTLLFCWMLFLLIEKEKKLTDWVMISLGLMLVIASSSRASLLSIVVFALIALVVKLHPIRKTYNRVVLNLVLTCSIIGCVLFIFIYAEAQYTELGIRINELSRQYFGKNLYSGRQIIWHELIAAIKEKPMIGYGLNTLPSDIYDTHLSAHNTFLQVVLQTGIIGLVLLMNIIVNISRKMIHCNDMWFSVIGIASVVSILLHECFEACLVQNMLVAGLQMWFIMGLCTNQSIVKRGVDKNE